MLSIVTKKSTALDVPELTTADFVYPSVLLAYLHCWLDAYKSGNISETVEDRAKVYYFNGLYKVVHGLRLPSECMTLNDL